jgi:hypothetical protein
MNKGTDTRGIQKNAHSWICRSGRSYSTRDFGNGKREIGRGGLRKISLFPLQPEGWSTMMTRISPMSPSGNHSGWGMK